MARDLRVRIIGDASSLHKAFGKASAASSSLGSSMARVGKVSAVALGAGLGVVAAGLKSSLSAAAEFESTLNSFKAVAGATDAQMRKISDTAKALGRDTKLPATSAKDAAEAMTELAKGGLNVNQTMRAARGVLTLSAAAQINNAQAATITARALNSFRLKGDQAVRVADVLANSANVSTGEIEDMAAALQQSSAVAAQAGLSIEDTAAAISLMANRGVVGSDAGTSLKTMLTRLLPTTEKAGKAMRQLGVNAFDSRGKMLPLRDIISQYSEALRRLTPEQQQMALQTIFGTDAIRAANIILREGVGAFDEMKEAVGRQGAASDLAAAKMKGYRGAMEAFKSQVETLQIELGERLLPVMTRLVTWANANFPAFERFVTQAFQRTEQAINALKPVFAALTAGMQAVMRTAQTVWPQVQEAAARVATWYRTQLEPAIRNVIAAVTAIWHRFGGDITRIARTAFATARSVIQAGLNIIRGVVEGVLALIRGDWQKAWDSLKTVVRNSLSGIGAIIRGFASIAFRAAVAIGAALIDGILAGVSSLGDRLRDAVTSKIQGAISGIKGAFDIRSPSGVTAREIGSPLGEGVVLGWVMGAAALPEKMKDSVRNAIEAARQAVATSRGRLADVWGGFTSDALAAFDAIRGGIQTRSEKILSTLQAQRAAADRASAIADARAGLAAALAGTAGEVDPEKVKAAQKALDDALFAQREFALQQRIIQERRELDARTALQRRHFEQALARQLEALSRQGASVGQATKAITKLLNKYDVDFSSAGDALGKAFVTGLKEAIVKAAKGAGSLGKVIESAAAGINVPGRAYGGPVAAGRAYMVGERGPELFVPNRSGGIVPNGALAGAGGDIVIQLDGETLARVNRRYAEKHARRNAY